MIYVTLVAREGTEFSLFRGERIEDLFLGRIVRFVCCRVVGPFFLFDGDDVVRGLFEALDANALQRLVGSEDHAQLSQRNREDLSILLKDKE